MQPTPTEAAQQEFEQQQAAFERARQKLAAARAPDEQSRPFSFVVPLRVQVLLPGLMLLLLLPTGALLTFWLDPTIGSEFDWSRHWRVVVAIALIGFTGIWLFRLGVVARRRISASEPDRAIIEFYKRVNHPLRHSQLQELVVSADSVPSPRRVPPTRLTESLAISTDWNPDLIDYWTTFTRNAKGLANTRHFQPRNISKCQVAPDLVLATFDLKRTTVLGSTSTVFIMAAFGVALGIPIALLGVWIGQVTDELIGPASIAVGFSYRWWIERRAETFKVRKLLIRCGDGWRLFCGDWEAYEEADLSWLDAMPHQEEAATPTPNPMH